MLVKGYLEIRKDIKPEHFSELEVSLKEDRKNCEANFVFMVRIIIAISFFKATVPEFTWLLYLIALIILIGGLILSVISYRSLNIIPTVFKKIYIEAEKYINFNLKVLNPDAKVKPDENT